MKAHVIENGLVINTIEVNSLDFMPNLVEATEGGIGWSYDNGVFTPPSMTAEEIKASAIAQINQTFEEEIAAIKEGYTEDEIKSWDQQLSEAIAYQNDQTAQTPLLDAILTNRGGTKDELVLRIATNASQYADVFGKALGKKQKAIADLG